MCDDAGAAIGLQVVLHRACDDTLADTARAHFGAHGHDMPAAIGPLDMRKRQRLAIPAPQAPRIP